MAKRDYKEQNRLDKLDESVYKKIGEKIEEYRKNPKHNCRGHIMTREEVAEEIANRSKVSLSRSTVERWVSGTRHPSIAHLVYLSQIFKCSLGDLIGFKSTLPRKYEVSQEYTGLSFDAVLYLHEMDPERRAILESILKSESGLDRILDNIVKAQKTNNEVLNAERVAEREIDNYIELKEKYFPEGKIPKHLEASVHARLFEQRGRIADFLRLVQLPLYKQENIKRDIREGIEGLLKSLIPEAESVKYPEPEKTIANVLDDEVQKREDIILSLD